MTAHEVVFQIGDCLAMSPEAFAGFDSLIVDPPYSDYVHKHMASHGSNGRGSRERDPGFSFLNGEARLHLARIAQRMARWSVIFTDHESSHLWRGEVQMGSTEYVRSVAHTPAGAEYEGYLPWVRWSQPQLSGDRPPQGSEAVLHFHRVGAKRTNCPGNLIKYDRRCMRGADKHPTEKPLDLMLDMVSWWSDVGESIVDPMAGAGTTALACLMLERSCLAIEQDPKWAAVYEARAAGDSKYTRDRDRAVEWCTTTRAEASAHLAKKPAKNGEDENTRRRASARLADVERVERWLAS